MNKISLVLLFVFCLFLVSVCTEMHSLIQVAMPLSVDGYKGYFFPITESLASHCLPNVNPIHLCIPNLVLTVCKPNVLWIRRPSTWKLDILFIQKFHYLMILDPFSVIRWHHSNWPARSSCEFLWHFKNLTNKTLQDPRTHQEFGDQYVVRSHITDLWLSARLQYFQCVSNGDTAVLQ